VIERLYYANGIGQTIEFSALSDFHVNVSRDVDGMNDVSNKVNTATTMGQDGESYISSTIEARDIEITGHLRSTSLQRQIELRRQLNHAMSPKQSGTLTYVCGDLIRQITCYAEKCPSYTQGRWPKFIIQMRCLSPFWQETSNQIVPVVRWEGMMAFEETDGLMINEEWEIGARSTERIVTARNDGDVACGMKIRFVAEGSVTNPYLTDAETLETVKIKTTMVAGDLIEVTTHYGQKDAVLVRSGIRTNIFRLLDASTIFIQLSVGDNLLTCGASSGANNMSVTVEYANRFLGV